jgi:hypothetical protein
MIKDKTMSGGILVLSANPRDIPWLRLTEEYAHIQLQLAQGRQLIDLNREPEVSVDNLLPVIANKQPRILHFCGHASNEGLYLVGDGGNAYLATVDEIDRAIRPFKEFVECVVFNACLTAVQAKIIHRHIPFVVGMNHRISDPAAINFVDGFYAGIAQCLSYKVAFQMGCSKIDLARLPENKIPVLFRRERMLPLNELLRNQLEETKDQCRRRNLPFRGPHLFMSLMHIIDKSASNDKNLSLVFDKVCPGLRQKIEARLQDFIDHQDKYEPGQFFFPFSFMDLNDFVLANNEAVDEGALEITQRHLMIGILIGDSNTSRLIRQLAGSAEIFNKLVAEVRKPDQHSYVFPANFSNL